MWVISILKHNMLALVLLTCAQVVPDKFKMSTTDKFLAHAQCLFSQRGALLHNPSGPKHVSDMNIIMLGGLSHATAPPVYMHKWSLDFK